jgi:hypothetical protein
MKSICGAFNDWLDVEKSIIINDFKLLFDSLYSATIARG